MDYERDAINRVVLPSVNELLQSRGDNVVLYAVDLRWGIDLRADLTQEVRDRMILDVCADEVRRCRPLFIGLVGGRYGWVAPPEIERTARERARIPDVGFPLSAMALEILTATLASQEDGVSPILLRRIVRDEHVIAAPRDSREAELLRQFAARLAASGHALQPYAAHWHTPAPQIEGRFESDEFAGLLIEGLMRAVAEVASTQAQVASWLDRDVELQRSEAVNQSARFVGREEDARFIDGFWDLKQLVPPPVTFAR